MGKTRRRLRKRAKTKTKIRRYKNKKLFKTKRFRKSHKSKRVKHRRTLKGGVLTEEQITSIRCPCASKKDFSNLKIKDLENLTKENKTLLIQLYRTADQFATDTDKDSNERATFIKTYMHLPTKAFLSRTGGDGDVELEYIKKLAEEAEKSNEKTEQTDSILTASNLAAYEADPGYKEHVAQAYKSTLGSIVEKRE